MGALARLKETKLYIIINEAFGALTGMVNFVGEEENKVDPKVQKAIEKMYENVVDRTGVEPKIQKDSDGYNELPNKLEIKAEVSGAKVTKNPENIERGKGGKQRTRVDE